MKRWFRPSTAINQKVRMKILLLGLSLLLSVPSYATTDDPPEEKLKFSVVPFVGYHFGFSELGDKINSTLSQGPLVGSRFKFTKANLFFAPDFFISGVFGLDPSPLPSMGVGFIAGGTFTDARLDAYVGVQIKRLVYNLDGLWTGRVGLAWEIVGDGLQVYVEGQLGKYNMPFRDELDIHNFFGVEGGLQLPFEL